MARLLSLALLSVSAVLTTASSSFSSTSRVPFCVSTRGGSSAGDAVSGPTDIPAGGASYSSQLESVKTSVLETASESVSEDSMYFSAFGNGLAEVTSLPLPPSPYRASTRHRRNAIQKLAFIISCPHCFTQFLILELCPLFLRLD